MSTFSGLDIYNLLTLCLRLPRFDCCLVVFGALVMHRAFPCAPARGSNPCACTLFAEDRVAISFSFAAELWLWRSRLDVFFFPASKLAVSAGVSCFCFVV
jgi:hypothetical protein